MGPNTLKRIKVTKLSLVSHFCSEPARYLYFSFWVPWGHDPSSRELVIADITQAVVDTIFCERYAWCNNEVQNEASEIQTIYLFTSNILRSVIIRGVIESYRESICALAIFWGQLYVIRGVIESYSKWCLKRLSKFKLLQDMLISNLNNAGNRFSTSWSKKYIHHQ